MMVTIKKDSPFRIPLILRAITLIIVDFCRMLKLYKLSRRYTLDIMHKTSQIEIMRKPKTPRLSRHENGEFKFVTKNQQNANKLQNLPVNQLS